MKVKVYTLSVYDTDENNHSAWAFATREEALDLLRGDLRGIGEFDDEEINSWPEGKLIREWDDQFPDRYFNIEEHHLDFTKMEFVKEEEPVDA